jgi:hypothetical protein
LSFALTVIVYRAGNTHAWAYSDSRSCAASLLSIAIEAVASAMFLPLSHVTLIFVLTATLRTISLRTATCSALQFGNGNHFRCLERTSQ